jgi:hypothetical protein
MFDLFDLAWGLGNTDEHGVDLETQRMIRSAMCEWAIRRIYHTSENLPVIKVTPFVNRWMTYFQNLSASKKLGH